MGLHPSMIVTISREYGAAALDVAHELGELLGYPVVGEDLPKIAALRLGTTQDDVVAAESRSPSLAERVLQNLGSGTPESQSAITAESSTFEVDVRKEIEAAVREAAQAPDVIIVGGIANVILRDRPDKVSVFLHAPLAYRIERLQASLGISAEAARKEIARVGEARRRWAKVHYDLVWGSAYSYDLAIDVARFGISKTVEIIATAVRQAQQ